MPGLDTAAWAAALAPHVDRLALCIHPPTSERAEVHAIRESLGLLQPTILVVAAPLIAGGRVSDDDVLLLNRYSPPDGVRAVMDAHRAAGLLDADGHPSDAFAEAARRIVALQVEEAARLWSGHEALVERLAELTASAVESAVSRARAPLPAFDQQRHPPEPPSAPGRLLRRVTVLRYLRADVHAAALAVAGQPGPEAERATNDGVAALLGALAVDERTELLDGYAQLPGDDPRLGPR